MHSRRAFLQTLLMSLFAQPASAFSAKHLKNTEDYFKQSHSLDLSEFTHVVSPNAHGSINELSGFKLNAVYPSRQQAMQFIFFYNQEKGLFIQTKAPLGTPAIWHIQNQVLHIHAPETTKIVQQKDLSPKWETAVSLYSSWLKENQYLPEPSSTAPHDFFMTASYENQLDNLKHARFYQQHLGNNLACWITQWRRHKFDTHYPDYHPRELKNFETLIKTLQSEGITPYPYFNGALIDSSTSKPKDTAEMAVLDPEGKFISYNQQNNRLIFACPLSKWREYLVEKINDLDNITNTNIPGCYVDVLSATRPQLCFAKHHDHEPGDPTAWCRGISEIYQAINKRLLVEANSELVVNTVEGLLMHLHSSRTNSIPLWNLIYGQSLHSYGWEMDPRLTEKGFTLAQQKVAEFKSKAFGSPWMSLNADKRFYALLAKK